jgi:hypothetical protein
MEANGSLGEIIAGLRASLAERDANIAKLER